MANPIPADSFGASRSSGAVRSRISADASHTAYQAYQVLHWGYAALPMLAGLDKFFHLLVNWDQYLAPFVPNLLHISAHRFMSMVGVVEIAAGLFVALKPKLGAYVVFAWLLGIMANLLLAGGWYDVALRDFGLSLGALALGRLAQAFDRS